MENNTVIEKNMVPLKEKLAYGLGDTATNLIYMMITMYLMYFYTDVFGLAAGVVSILFIIGRVWDAVNDPIMGLIADRTHTKWGSYRPYLLWMALPTAIFAVLLFFTPNFTLTGKIIYAYITYMGFDMAYTAISLPYSSMLPSITNNYRERSTVSAIRMFMSRIGSIIVTASTLTLVSALGHGNEKSGFFYTMIIFAGLATVMFLLSFVGTKERITQPKQKISFLDSLKSIKGNTPWFVLFLVNMSLWTGMTLMLSMAVYFFKYNVGNANLASAFTPILMISMLVSYVFVPILSKKFKKKTIFVLGMSIYFIGLVLIYIFSSMSMQLIFIATAVSGLGAGLGSALLYSMLADTVDYGEWKSGIRAQAFLFSAASFAIKFGQGIGGALGGWILEGAGYIANVDQTEAALNAIRINFIVIPAITAAIIIALISLFYKLDKNYDAIKIHLAAKHSEPSTIA